VAKKVVVVLFITFMTVFFCLGLPVPGEKVQFVVKKGESSSAVASRLREQNLIFSKRLFLFFVKLTNSQKKLKVGTYELSGSDGMFKILKKLRNNFGNFIKITIPEGNTIAQTACIIAEKVKIDKDKFVKIAMDRNLEGYLMPETYFVYPDISEEDLIEMLYNEFRKKITPDMYERAKELKIPFKDIITMASIIEKEVFKFEEKALVSAVFYNRIKKNMRLQSDVTVLYAMGNNKNNISLKCTKFKSPYNTYLHSGLPVGPICSPGMQSIKAALYPADSEVLYFVSIGNGSHLFAKTFLGHLKNKQIVKKLKMESRNLVWN
jgi:UPF0755 protein